MSVPEPVRCADCGLLSLRDETTGDFLEVDEVYRTQGKRNGILNRADPAMVCLAAAADLRKEFHGIPGADGSGRTLQVIGLSRPCPSMRKWVQGFTPKEHAQMMHAERVEQLAEDRKLADEERAERRRRSDRVWQVALVALSAISGLAGVLVGKYLPSSTQPAPVVNVQFPQPSAAPTTPDPGPIPKAP
jgi:hypothetical protein